MCSRLESSWARISRPWSHRGEPKRLGRALTPIDLARVAEAFGIASFHADSAENCGAALDSALAQEGPALVEALVDPYEPLLPAKRIEKYARNLEKALNAGTRDAEEIRLAMAREPSRTQLTGDGNGHDAQFI